VKTEANAPNENVERDPFADRESLHGPVLRPFEDEVTWFSAQANTMLALIFIFSRSALKHTDVETRSQVIVLVRI
jgi:hypothetical protein